MRSAYDRIARAYDDTIGRELESKPLDRAFVRALAALADGVVADLGCGPGHVTRDLGTRCPSVLGIDLSLEMARVARRHDPGGAYAVGSVLALPLATATLAAAAVLYSIIHLPATKPEITGITFLPNFNNGSVSKRRKSAIGPCQSGLMKFMIMRIRIAKNKISQG